MLRGCPQLFTKAEEKKDGRNNRWNYVVVECRQGGGPRKTDRAASASDRRKTSSMKVILRETSYPDLTMSAVVCLWKSADAKGMHYLVVCVCALVNLFLLL